MRAHPPALRTMEVAGGVFALVVGTLLHFVYGWSGGSPVVALFAPVNESVWEHLKLLFFPIAVVGIAEAWWIDDIGRLVWAKLAGSLAGLLFIAAFFYTYTGALGVESLWADIASFAAAVALCQWLSARILTASRSLRHAAVAALLLGALAVMFMICTFQPPHLPLFHSGVGPAYGTGP